MNDLQIKVEWITEYLGITPLEGTRQAGFINGKYTVFPKPQHVTVYQIAERVSRYGSVFSWEDCVYNTRDAAETRIKAEVRI